MSIHHEASMLGLIMSADKDIVVECRGDVAYVEGKRVVIPAIETFTSLSTPNAYRLFQAFLDHEMGHAIDSDLKLFARLGKEKGAAYSLLLNALEDGYVEGRRGVVYPGVRFNLRKKNEWFWSLRINEEDLTVEERIREPKNLWGGFVLACTMLVRRDGSRSLEYIQALNDDLAPLLELVADDLAVVATLYCETKQTKAVAEIASRIFEGLKELSDEHEDSSSEDSEVKAQASKLLLAFDGYRGSGIEPMSPEGALQVVVRKALETPASTRPYIVFDPSFDIERDFSQEDLAPHTKEYDAYAEETALSTDALVLAFESALRCRREKRPVRGADCGELDVSILSEFAVGAVGTDELYLRYVGEDDDAAAVALLIDCSGSMSRGPGSPSHLARVVGIAMSEALKRVQIPHEVTGFTTLRSDHVNVRHLHFWARGLEKELTARFAKLRRVCSEAERHGTDLSKFARTTKTARGPLMLPIYGVFKSFENPDARGLVHVTGISQNLDGEAVLWQARRLAQRPERRRVMFVISDGYPAGSHDNAQGARYLRESVERVIAAGIEVYGLGIMSSAVQEFYPTWWVCNDLDDLIDLAMNALTEAVARTRTERSWVVGF